MNLPALLVLAYTAKLNGSAKVWGITQESEVLHNGSIQPRPL